MLEQWIRGFGGQQLDLRLGEVLPPAQAIFGRIPGILTTTFGALASTLVIVVVGLYAAAHPAPYVSGFARLFPIERRDRVRRLLGEIGHVLRRWMVGQLISMAAVGVLSYLGLLLLGVPLALGLAVLTGLLEFVPYVGPIAAAVPAVLVGLTEGPAVGLYVVLLYVGVQTAESYLITPLVQERAVYLPPAVIVVFQVLMGVLFGVLGVLLATSGQQQGQQQATQGTSHARFPRYGTSSSPRPRPPGSNAARICRRHCKNLGRGREGRSAGRGGLQRVLRRSQPAGLRSGSGAHAQHDVPAGPRGVRADRRHGSGMRHGALGHRHDTVPAALVSPPERGGPGAGPKGDRRSEGAEAGKRARAQPRGGDRGLLPRP